MRHKNSQYRRNSSLCAPILKYMFKNNIYKNIYVHMHTYIYIWLLCLFLKAVLEKLMDSASPVSPHTHIHYHQKSPCSAVASVIWWSKNVTGERTRKYLILAWPRDFFFLFFLGLDDSGTDQTPRKNLTLCFLPSLLFFLPSLLLLLLMQFIAIAYLIEKFQCPMSQRLILP